MKVFLYFQFATCHGLPAFFFALDPTKYFGCELGAQTQIDLKNERYIVNGSHDADKLQEILDGFIEKFVLCPDCENPETVLVMCYLLLRMEHLGVGEKGLGLEY